jgi:hypothetical protein
MSKALQIITENTGVSITVLIVVIGFSAWLTNLHAKADTIGEHVSKIEAKQDLDEARQQNLELWLTRIEGKLDRSLKR